MLALAPFLLLHPGQVSAKAPGPLVVADREYRYIYTARHGVDGTVGTLSAVRLSDGKRVARWNGLPPPGCGPSAAPALPMNRISVIDGRSYAVVCGSDEGRSNLLLILSRGRLLGRLDFAEQPPAVSWSAQERRFVAPVERRVLQPQGNLYPLLTIYELDPRTAGFRLAMSPRHAPAYAAYYRKLKADTPDGGLIAESLLGALVATGDAALICSELRNGPLASVPAEAIDAAAADLTVQGFPDAAVAACNANGRP